MPKKTKQTSSLKFKVLQPFNHYQVGEEVVIEGNSIQFNGLHVPVKELVLQKFIQEIPSCKKWKPKEGDKYWYVNCCGAVLETYVWNKRNGFNVLAFGNYYKTEEEAVFALNKQLFITRLNDRIDELNGDWEWNNDEYYTIKLNYECGLENSTNFFDKPLLISKIRHTETLFELIKEFGEEEIKKYLFNC